MTVVKHLCNNVHFIVYFDGSTTTVYSNSRFYFFFVAATPHLYVEYIED